jgi:hypothetical protein
MKKISEVKSLNEIRVFSFKDETRKFTISIDNKEMSKEKAKKIILDIKEIINQNCSLDNFEFDIDIRK